MPGLGSSAFRVRLLCLCLCAGVVVCVLCSWEAGVQALHGRSASHSGELPMLVHGRERGGADYGEGSSLQR